MNYYSPYMSMAPYMSMPAKAGLFSKLLGGNGLTLGSILSGTQKAIGFANQAIPLVKQVSPVVKNAKTMFRVMNEFKKVDTPNTSNINKASSNTSNVNNENIIQENTYDNNGPTFFI